MSIFSQIYDFVASASGNALGRVVEAVRTLFEGDPETRRRVAFSIAMIALSAKMAKADGIVTADEVAAFRQVFSFPEQDAVHVSRLYNLAKQDVAGFEAYAEKMARLCGSGERNCAMLEDILDGLFHIAKADGLVHERERTYLHNVAAIFGIEESHFDSILSRHVDLGARDPYTALGLERDAPLDVVHKRYRDLVRESHPDKLIARGVPEEFIAIANGRMAALNAAYETIERAHRRREAADAAQA